MKEHCASNLIHIKDIYNEVSLHVYYQDTTSRMSRPDRILYTTYPIQLGRKENFRIWKITKIENPRRKNMCTCNQAFLQIENLAHILECNRKMSIFYF